MRRDGLLVIALAMLVTTAGSMAIVSLERGEGGLSLLTRVVAGIAIFLIGANAAIIYRYWPEPWLTAKLAAASMLLFYCALTAVTKPAVWHVWVGLAAITFDAGAIAGIWHSLHKSREGDGVLIAYRRR